MSHWGSRCACARNSEPDRIYFVQFGLLDSLPKCLKIKKYVKNISGFLLRRTRHGNRWTERWRFPILWAIIWPPVEAHVANFVYFVFAGNYFHSGNKPKSKRCSLIHLWKRTNSLTNLKKTTTPSMTLIHSKPCWNVQPIAVFAQQQL